MRQMPGTSRFTLVVVGEEKEPRRKTKKEKRRIRKMHRQQREDIGKEANEEKRDVSIRPSYRIASSGSFKR